MQLVVGPAIVNILQKWTYVMSDVYLHTYY